MANKKPSELNPIAERSADDVVIIETPSGDVVKDTRASISERFEYNTDDRNDPISADYFYFLFTKSYMWQIRRQDRATGDVMYAYGTGDPLEAFSDRDNQEYNLT